MELSRNIHHRHITFVGEKRPAAERLWNTLCQTTQWTALTESIVDSLAITLKGNEHPEAIGVIDIADTFPWRVCDQFIPCSNSGFVYLLVSTPAPERVYVGTTKNLAFRLTQHNRGRGSIGTGANPEFLPWAVLSYMTNMASLSNAERMGLEGKWQVMNTRSVVSGMACIEQYIENGRRVVNEHNTDNQNLQHRKINYVVLAERRYALEKADKQNDGPGSEPPQVKKRKRDHSAMRDEKETDDTDDTDNVGNGDDMDIGSWL